MINLNYELLKQLGDLMETYQVVIVSQECIEFNGKEYYKTHLKLFCKIAECEEQEFYILSPK